MSTLADAIASDRTTKGPPCETRRLMETLPADQQADLWAAFMSDKPTTAIVRALVSLGHEAPSTLWRHRRTVRGETGGCKCPRTV